MGPRMAQTGTERPDHPSARERAGSGVDAADLRVQQLMAAAEAEDDDDDDVDDVDDVDDDEEEPF